MLSALELGSVRVAEEWEEQGLALARARQPGQRACNGLLDFRRRSFRRLSHRSHVGQANRRPALTSGCSRFRFRGDFFHRGRGVRAALTTGLFVGVFVAGC